MLSVITMRSFSTTTNDSRTDRAGSAMTSAAAESSSGRVFSSARYSSIGGNPTSSGVFRWKTRTATNTTTTIAAPAKNAARQLSNTLYATQPSTGAATRPPNA